MRKSEASIKSRKCRAGLSTWRTFLSGVLTPALHARPPPGRQAGSKQPASQQAHAPHAPALVPAAPATLNTLTVLATLAAVSPLPYILALVAL